MENPKNCVTQIKIHLQEISSDIQQIRGDSSFHDWEKMDLEKYHSTLNTFGIDIKRILQTIQKLKIKIAIPAKEISKLENNICHLAIDIESGDIEENQAKQQCEIIRNETNNNAKAVKKLRQELIFLQDAANTIRRNLTLVELVPMAQKITDGKQAKYFSAGLSYLSMLEEKSASDQVSIHELVAETAQLEAKFTRLELPELPSLAETILANHVNTCLSTTALIGQFLVKCRESGNTNLKNFDQFIQDLESYAALPLSNILGSFSGQVEKLKDLVCDLHKYSSITEDIKKANVLIQSINTLYVALKYDYLEHLYQQTKLHDSSLGPSATAAHTVLDFFRGFKGIIRNFRLMFGGPDRGEEKPDIYLTNLLATTINTCSYYYGSEKSDLSKITQFIDNQLTGCPKPFPYNDFFKVIKKAIAVYGQNVERDFYHYKIYSSAAQYKDEKLPEESSPNKSQTTFGRVIGRIDLLSIELKNSMDKFKN